MARNANVIAANRNMVARALTLPRTVRQIYERGPDSFTNLSIYGFGVSGLWTAVGTVLLQFRVLDFAAEDQKNGMLGAIALAGLISAAVAQPLAGAISDRSRTRWGKRLPYIIAGNLGLAALAPLMGIANSFLALLAVVAVMQLFGNLSQGPANALLMDHIPRHRRGAGAGALNLARASGGGVVTVIVMLLMSRQADGEGPSGWYWASIALVAAVLIAVTLWTAGALRPRRGSGRGAGGDSGEHVTPSVLVTSESSGRRSPGGRRAAPSSPSGLYWFLAAMAMIVASLTAMQTFALFFIRDKVALDNPAAGAALLAVAVGLGATVAVYPAGAISDRFGRMPVLYVAPLLAAAASSLLLFVSSIAHLVVLGAFIGIGSAMFLSGGWALVTELVPQDTAARSLGLTAFATLAGAGMARLSGFGIDALNNRSANLGYDVLIVSVASLLALSTFPLWRAGLALSRSTAPGAASQARENDSGAPASYNPSG